MSAYRRPIDVAALAQNFLAFANAECAHEPLYGALSRAIAGDRDILDLLLEAPYPQRRPVLLFAATHDRLRLVLASLDSETPIALIDVGCSAGLNLLVDRFRFVYRLPDHNVHTIGPESPVMIPVAFDGDHAFPFDRTSMPAVVRHQRLAGAIGLAREMRRTEPDTALDLRCGNANELLPAIVDGIDPAVRPVVFHSWVVSYFEREARQRFAEMARAVVARRNGVWISAEAAGVVPGLAAPSLATDADPERREATLWHVTTRDAEGACEVRSIARTHPHCRWIEWLDPKPRIISRRV